MWYGIAIGQKIQGLDTIKQVWSTFSNSLSFSLGNIEAEYIQTSSKTCEVMMLYVVTVHYPNGGYGAGVSASAVQLGGGQHHR